MKFIEQFRGKYYFLSNFYSPAEVEYEGIKYPTTEHAYQAAKTLDIVERQKIANLDSPSKSKKAGQDLEIREDWENIKNQVMFDVCTIKFQIPDLKKLLLETGDAHLIEGNIWHDNWYGVCYCRNCPKHKLQPVEKQNHLGKILMKIRNSLQEQ